MIISRRNILHGISATIIGSSISQLAGAQDERARFQLGSVKTDRRLEQNSIGLSFEKTELTRNWLSPDQKQFMALLRRLGPGVIRIGGNGVDTSSWRGAIPSLTPIEPKSVDSLAEFLKLSGWSIIYGVNMANTTPDLVVEEIRYVLPRLGSSLLAVQIGNEPNYYRDHYRPKNWTFEDYFIEWQTDAKAIRSAFPNVSLIGPSSVAHFDYAVEFANRASKNIWLGQHYYRGNGRDPRSTAELLLTPDQNLDDMLSALTPLAKADHLNGFILDEANSYYSGGAAGVSDRYASALWSAWFLAETTSRGVHTVNFHGGGAVYSPIYFNHKGTVEVRPAYYGLLLFSQFCGGQYRNVKRVSAENQNVSCYSLSASDGRENVLLFNLDFKKPTHFAIGGVSSGDYRVIRLQGPDATVATGITLGNAIVSPDAEWSPASEILSMTNHEAPIDLSPLSAVLLQKR